MERFIAVRPVQFTTKVYDDSGSGAHLDLVTWKPQLEDGWSYLGPGANNGGNEGTPGVIVKRASEIRVLAPIVDWELVWNDAGSGKSSDYALWRGLPALEDRIDFVVVGGFFVRSHEKPTADDAKGMMAVLKDALVTVGPGKQIWTDGGSGAHMNGAVWGVSTDGYLQGAGTGAFVPVEGYDSPPRNTYALDRSRIAPGYV